MADLDDLIAVLPELQAARDAVYTALTLQAAWDAGSATGGPESDGRYPLPAPGGGTVLVRCPARIAAMMPAGGRAAIDLACFAERQIVQVPADGSAVRRHRAKWAYTITELRASLATPDQSPTGSAGLLIDVLVNGSSMLGTMPGDKLTVLPGQITSKAAGTPQATIVEAAVPDDALIEVKVLLSGVGARGLSVALIGTYDD